MITPSAVPRSCAAVAAFLAMALCGARASAQTPATPGASDMIEAHAPPTERAFYGWQVAAVGEVGALLTSAALVLPDRLLSTTPSSGAFIIGVPTMLLGAPIVHWSHNNFEKGMVSLAANATLPLIGGFTGRAIACSGEHADDCAYRGFGTGFALVAIVVPLVDALVLGWEDVPLEEVAPTGPGARREGRWASDVGLVPTVDLRGPLTVRLSAVGRF